MGVDRDVRALLIFVDVSVLNFGLLTKLRREVVKGELCARAELCALRAGLCAPGSDFGEVVTGELCARAELCAPSCDAV